MSFIGVKYEDKHRSIYMERHIRFYHGSPILLIFMNMRESFDHIIKSFAPYIYILKYKASIHQVSFITSLSTCTSFICLSLSHIFFLFIIQNIDRDIFNHHPHYITIFTKD